MVTRINYNDIKDLKPAAVFSHLNNLSKFYVRDLLVKDLLNEGVWEKSVKDFYFVDMSPRGIYMFFKEDKVRYIGQTNQSFYQRLPTQLDTYVYPGGFGWNSMIRIMGGNRTGKLHKDLTTEDHEIDYEEMIGYKLLLIEVDRCDRISAYNLLWIEKILLKTYRELAGGMLLNNRIGWLNKGDWDKTLDELIQ
ncbi:hypothetical protein [Chitinophaga hostae]|uniref:hypothetical protein n=1 Tax=Chitinophaga hostae TaxID=2831022 RepID=UPI003F69CB83